MHIHLINNCVVQALNRYLEMMKDRRDPSRAQLILSYRNPYKEIASSTVSSWIKEVLELANGIQMFLCDTPLDQLPLLRSTWRYWLYQIYHIGGHGQEHQLGKNFTIIKLFHQKRNSSILFSKTINIRFKRGQRGLGTGP